MAEPFGPLRSHGGFDVLDTETHTGPFPGLVSRVSRVSRMCSSEAEAEQSLAADNRITSRVRVRVSSEGNVCIPFFLVSGPTEAWFHLQALRGRAGGGGQGGRTCSAFLQGLFGICVVLVAHFTNICQVISRSSSCVITPSCGHFLCLHHYRFTKLLITKRVLLYLFGLLGLGVLGQIRPLQDVPHDR